MDTLSSPKETATSLLTKAAEELVLDVSEYIDDELSEADAIYHFLEKFQFEIEGRLIDNPNDLALSWVLERLRRRSL